MTASTIALAELAEKGADVDVLRQMVQFMAQRLMEIDVEGRCGAGYSKRKSGGVVRIPRCPHPVFDIIYIVAYLDAARATTCTARQRYSAFSAHAIPPSRCR